MPDLKIRRLLLIAGLVGMVFACAGLTQLATAQNTDSWNGGRWLLLVAWLILMPLFIYVMGLRQAARRVARRRAQAKRQALDADVARLRTPEGIRAAGGGEPPPPPAS